MTKEEKIKILERENELLKEQKKKIKMDLEIMRNQNNIITIPVYPVYPDNPHNYPTITC